MIPWLEKYKTVINIAFLINRFELFREIVEPRLLMKWKEYVDKGGPHGYPIYLIIKSLIEQKMAVLNH